MHKTITIDGVDYYLIPKPKSVELPEGIEVVFDKISKETHFDVKVRGWTSWVIRSNVKVENPWCLFRRIEKEDGSYQWRDYTAGDSTPTKERLEILESWYQKFSSQHSKI